MARPSKNRFVEYCLEMLGRILWRLEQDKEGAGTQSFSFFLFVCLVGWFLFFFFLFFFSAAGETEAVKRTLCRVTEGSLQFRENDLHLLCHFQAAG